MLGRGCIQRLVRRRLRLIPVLRRSPNWLTPSYQPWTKLNIKEGTKTTSLKNSRWIITITWTCVKIVQPPLKLKTLSNLKAFIHHQLVLATFTLSRRRKTAALKRLKCKSNLKLHSNCNLHLPPLISGSNLLSTLSLWQSLLLLLPLKA